MKCLTTTETQDWLAPLGITITKEATIDFRGPTRMRRHSVQRRFPSGEVSLWRIAEAIVSWLPHSNQRLLWLSRWETYPPGQVNFVEKLRKSCGEARTLSDVPGHLFERTAYSDYEDRSPDDVDSEAVLAGLVLLVLSLEWDAVLFSDAGSDFVSISDGFVIFSSEHADRMASVPGTPAAAAR